MSRLRFRYVLSKMLALRLPNIEKSKVMNNFDILMPGIWFCCYYTKLSQYKYKPKVELVERIKIITRMSCTFYISIIHIGIKVINNSVCCYYTVLSPYKYKYKPDTLCWLQLCHNNSTIIFH